MGTCYYLIREDDQVYDLGKAYGWCDQSSYNEVAWFTADNPQTLTQGEAREAANLTANALILHWGWKEGEDIPPYGKTRDYLRAVFEDIADWAEGKSFTFVSEHSGLFENLVMKGWPEDRETYEREEYSGSRFTGDMERLRAKRHAPQTTCFGKAPP